MNLSASMNSWRLMSFFAIAIGLYPIVFFLPGSNPGFLQGKADVTGSTLWWIAFYMHIIGGGVALLTGWIQFWKSFRTKRLKAHRKIGLIYWIAILLVGGPGALYAAYYAMGGFPAKMGFTLLGIFWIFYRMILLQVYLLVCDPFTLFLLMIALFLIMHISNYIWKILMLL